MSDENIGTTVKKPNFKQSIKRIFAYLGSQRIPFMIAIVLAVLGTICTLVGPDFLKRITDLVEKSLHVGGYVDMDAVVSIALLLVSIYLISFIMNFIREYMLSTIAQRTAKRLRTDVSKKINRLPLRYFDKSSTGDVLSRVTNDIDTFGEAVGDSIGMFITSVVMLVGSVFLMAITSPTMALAAIGSSLIGFALMIVIVRFSQKYFVKRQADLGLMNGHVEEMYSNHLIVKAYSGEKTAKLKFDDINEGLYESTFKSQFLSGLVMPIMMFVSNLGYVVVCIVGAVLVLNGSISIGVIVAFMMYVRFFTQPLQQISQAFTLLQSMAAASDRVFDFLEEEEIADEKDKIAKITNVKGAVEFKNVRFGYTPGKEVIRGFSADILPGQKVAIVGPTGAGKTTVVNLLMRFYDVDSGDILIDGISIKDMKREDVRDLFCMVLQDTWVFEGTIKENLAYNKEDVTDEDVRNACKAVGIDHFISTLPGGYNAILDDKTTMSVGQKQQITIARAIIEDSPLLILDEATSSVDTKTEKNIQNAMDELVKGRTSFVIAHRLSTIRNSDVILVMKDGDIIEHGTHDELLADGGFYCELYNSQFEEAIS